MHYCGLIYDKIKIKWNMWFKHEEMSKVPKAMNAFRWTVVIVFSNLYCFDYVQWVYSMLTSVAKVIPFRNQNKSLEGLQKIWRPTERVDQEDFRPLVTSKLRCLISKFIETGNVLELVQRTVNQRRLTCKQSMITSISNVCLHPLMVQTFFGSSSGSGLNYVILYQLSLF